MSCQRQLQAPKHQSTKEVTAATQEIESLFDGTLGDWKTKPVSFQLKEWVSPYHGQAFLVPKIHKDTIMKEVELVGTSSSNTEATNSLIYVCKGKKGQLALQAMVSKEGDTIVKIEFYPMPHLEQAATDCCEENLGADQSDLAWGIWYPFTSTLTTEPWMSVSF